MARHGQRVALGNVDAAIVRGSGFGVQLWGARTGKKRGELAKVRDLIEDFAFSPDGRLLVTADDSGDLVVWDLRSREQRGAPIVATRTLRRCQSVLTGRSSLRGGRDAFVKLWDLETGRALGNPMPTGLPVAELEFDSTGGTLIARGENGKERRVVRRSRTGPTVVAP